MAVDLDVMSEEQRRELQTRLRGGRVEREIPFAQPSSLTQVYAVASGKGGVGKSSVTVNLAAALAASGQKVGVLDADIYGHSVPRMLGVTGRPTQVEQMLMPPSAHVDIAKAYTHGDSNAPVVLVEFADYQCPYCQKVNPQIQQLKKDYPDTAIAEEAQRGLDLLAPAS